MSEGKFTAAIAAVLFLMVLALALMAFSDQRESPNADIVCVSAGQPVLRAQGKEVRRDNGVLHWSDDENKYSTNADCIVRSAK
jgi:hypothetical protein